MLQPASELGRRARQGRGHSSCGLHRVSTADTATDRPAQQQSAVRKAVSTSAAASTRTVGSVRVHLECTHDHSKQAAALASGIPSRSRPGCPSSASRAPTSVGTCSGDAGSATAEIFGCETCARGSRSCRGCSSEHSTQPLAMRTLHASPRRRHGSKRRVVERSLFNRCSERSNGFSRLIAVPFRPLLGPRGGADGSVRHLSVGSRRAVFGTGSLTGIINGA